MSIIKSIKQVLGLSGTASENHFWDGSAPNQLSLKRGTPEAPGAELIKALNGVLSFPSQGQLLAANGYVKLPGGLIIQWGNGTTSAAGETTVPYAIAFPNVFLGATCTPKDTTNAPVCQAQSGGLGALKISGWVGPSTRVATDVFYIAIGY